MDQRTALHQRPGIQKSRREFFAPLFTSGIMLGTIHPFSLLGSEKAGMAPDRYGQVTFRVGELKNIPCITGDIPAVFAWYPMAGKASIWNVEETRRTCQIKRNNEILQTVAVDGLDVALLKDI